MILLRPICWLLGHRRGKLKFTDLATLSRYYACPRCSRETRYRLKPKSADVLQISLTERKST